MRYEFLFSIISNLLWSGELGIFGFGVSSSTTPRSVPPDKACLINESWWIREWDEELKLICDLFVFPEDRRDEEDAEELRGLASIDWVGVSYGHPPVIIATTAVLPIQLESIIITITIKRKEKLFKKIYLQKIVHLHLSLMILFVYRCYWHYCCYLEVHLDYMFVSLPL